MAGVPEGVVLCIQCDTAHLYRVLALLYLLFGIDPKLPADLLFPPSEDAATNSGEWLAQHQNRLREAHCQALRKLEAAARKQSYDSRKKVDPACIGIGERVLLRSHPQGRKKIQDKWGSKVFKVTNRQGNVYEVEPADGVPGPSKTVNRAELQVFLKPTVQPQRRTHAVRAQTPLPNSSSEDSSEEGDLEVCIYPGERIVRGHPEPEAQPGRVEPASPPLRRSTRSTRGQHRNRFRDLY